jgi:CTP synthase
MCLGARKTSLKKDTKIADIYGSTDISERHRYEVIMGYKDRLDSCSLLFSCRSPDGVSSETVEYRAT